LMSSQLFACPYRCAGDLDDLVKGDGRGRSRFDGGEEGARASLLALVLTPQIHLPETRPSESPHAAEVLNLQDAAGHEYFDALFRKLRRAVGEIVNRSYRAVRHRERYGCLVFRNLHLWCASDAACFHRADRRAAQEADQVDEVAGFADYAPAANDRVLGPVAGWYCPGIHRDNKDLWLLYRGEEGFHPHRVRREAAIEANHQTAPSSFLVGSDDLVDLRFVQRQWLLDKHVLAGAQGARGQARMRIVACRDHHRVRGGVVQHRIHICSG